MLAQVQPMETLGMLDAIDFQELSSPTKIDTITIYDHGQRPRTQPVRRRVLDIQLWRNLSHDQQTAAEKIEAGFKLICAGLGSKGQTFSPLRGGSSLSGRGEHLLLCYGRWTHECERLSLPVNLALGVLVEGRTIISYAREYRCRAAVAKQLFAQLLDAYCAVNRV